MVRMTPRNAETWRANTESKSREAGSISSVDGDHPFDGLGNRRRRDDREHTPKRGHTYRLIVGQFREFLLGLGCCLRKDIVQRLRSNRRHGTCVPTKSIATTIVPNDDVVQWPIERVMLVVSHRLSPRSRASPTATSRGASSLKNNNNNEIEPHVRLIRPVKAADKFLHVRMYYDDVAEYVV
jgi:hypothetical protein